jgi:ferredoxin
MPLVTAEADRAADVVIDAGRCTRCGACVEVCPGGPLLFAGDRVEVDPTRLLGCIGCGQCMAVCAWDAVSVTGRGLSPADVFPLPAPAARTSFAALEALLHARRSCRTFAATPVAPADVHRIIMSASTAPVSVPPGGVGVLVHEGAENVQAFRRDLCAVLRRKRWLLRPPAAWLWRLLLSRTQWRFVRSFVEPTFQAYLGERRELPADADVFFYRAPLALSFYGSETADPADATIAATHAMLAAEALGYGTCFLGFPALLLSLAPALRRQYGLPPRSRAGLTLIVGRRTIQPVRGLHRRLARVDCRYVRGPETRGR